MNIAVGVLAEQLEQPLFLAAAQACVYVIIHAVFIELRIAPALRFYIDEILFLFLNPVDVGVFAGLMTHLNADAFNGVGEDFILGFSGDGLVGITQRHAERLAFFVDQLALRVRLPVRRDAQRLPETAKRLDLFLNRLQVRKELHVWGIFHIHCLAQALNFL